MLPRLTQWTAALFLLTLIPVTSGIHGHVFLRAIQTRHGLTGSYYVSTLETHSDVNPSGQDWYVQVWFDPKDFQLPQPFTAPAAVRVNPQLAFGQGKGFAVLNGKQTKWWPTDIPWPVGWTGWQAADSSVTPSDYLAAVIWKGYIHLPNAGTYYLATVSKGASAVYLNQARVALNGTFGGVLVSDAFTYAKDDLRDYLQNIAHGREDLLFQAQPGERYVLPITVEAPRDLPIEVRYNGWRSETTGRGIDLFWVTPNSPRDPSGKPIAQLVPSDVLYTEPPGPIEKPTVRGANSMLSADFLYFPSIRTDKDVSVTVHLADKDGNPVAGKHVHVGSLVSYGGADLIKQPEKPTDEKGETTAGIRPGESYKVTHDSKILATDVTDLVDVAQVAHVTFQAGTVVDFFFPDAFSPYYDPDLIKAEPLPLIAGRPVTISVALENRTKDAAELTATFKAKGLNIGAVQWPEIGKVEHIRLKPGEARRVSINWTPGQATTSLCFKVEVSVQFDGRAAAMSEGRVLTAFALPVAIWAQQGGAAPQNSAPVQGSVQRNMGPVKSTCPMAADQPVPTGSWLNALRGWDVGDPHALPGFLFIDWKNPNEGRPTVHQQPSVNSPVVASPPRGMRLVYRGIKDVKGKKWYYVEPASAPRGWLSEDGASFKRPPARQPTGPLHVTDSKLGTVARPVAGIACAARD